MTFGKRLKVLRRAKGMSQAKLAKAAGIHRVYISKYENESEKHLNPTLFNMQQLATALGCEIRALVSNEDAYRTARLLAKITFKENRLREAMGALEEATATLQHMSALLRKSQAREPDNAPSNGVGR